MPANVLEGLNPVQEEAVRAVDGPLLILAGPGSGKTRVIAHRIAYLVAECGVHPYRILAVTFTNKAAREMRERVKALLGEDAAPPWMGTFHANCARMLRADGPAIGIDRGFAIYDDDDQIALMKRVLHDLGIDPKRFAPRAILSAISAAKSELVGAEDYQRSVRSYFEEIVGRCYGGYQSLLQANNAVDFDDLIMRAVHLLQEVQDVREKYQNRFLHVHIDEFQDTNIAQYALARILAGRHRNICVVGDPDQSIYSWRSADIRNILNFERDYADARVVMLEQNYRSTQTILDTAHAVIRANEQRKEKNLWTDRGGGHPISVFEAYDEVEEADFVAAEVQALGRQDHPPGDIAVMYRTNAQSRALEESFIRERIPYRLVGATRFYERREVKDVLAYIRLLLNPLDTVSFGRVVNVPSRGIGDRTLEELDRWSKSLQVAPWLALEVLADRDAEGGSHPFTSRAARALIGFRNAIRDLVEIASVEPLSATVSAVADRVQYRRYLLDEFDDGEERWENVRELQTVAGDYDALEPSHALASFLEDVALVSDQDAYDERVNAVTLITLHAAKGLEFPVVFIVGMEEGLLPHVRSFDDVKQMEEERRLCYVGITRARERVYLVHSFRRHVMGSSSHAAASRFLKDIPQELLVRPQALRQEVAQLQARQEEKRRQQVPSEAAFTAGERVRHPRFGEGIVVSCVLRSDDQEVTVAFKGDAGVKKLLLSFAPLEKVRA